MELETLARGFNDLFGSGVAVAHPMAKSAMKRAVRFGNHAAAILRARAASGAPYSMAFILPP